MGNQAYNYQYAKSRNWITQNSTSTLLQTQSFPHPAKTEQTMKTLEKPQYLFQNKTHRLPLQEKAPDSKFRLQTQVPKSQLRHSSVTLGSQQHKNISEYDLIRGSTVGCMNQNRANKQSVQVKILIKPQYSKSGSILQKNVQSANKNFSLDSLTQQIDDIRVPLRHYQSQFIGTMVDQFQQNINSLDEMIQIQRQLKLKDKNKVLFLLRQKKHYHKLCLKFKEFDEKIKTLLFQYRKKDTVYQISQKQIMEGMQLKSLVQTIISKIQKQQSQKVWKLAIDKPSSKYYIGIVTNAIHDPEIMNQFTQLQKSLTNSDILKQIVNKEMIHSIKRRMGGQNNVQNEKKLIQGPAHYHNNMQMMRGNNYPIR